MEFLLKTERLMIQPYSCLLYTSHILTPRHLRNIKSPAITMKSGMNIFLFILHIGILCVHGMTEMFLSLIHILFIRHSSVNVNNEFSKGKKKENETRRQCRI